MKKIILYIPIILFISVQLWGRPAEKTTHYRYLPVANKLVGVWPDDTYYSAEGFRKLRELYGFSGLMVEPIDSQYNLSNEQYKQALDAGFDPQNMIINTWEHLYLYCVDSMPAKYYYLGECVEHDCYGHPSNVSVSHIYSLTELAARRDYIHANRPDSKFIIDGYKRCSHLLQAGQYADVVMYSAYCNWNSTGLPICHPNIGWGDSYEAPYVQGDNLQTGSWSDMKNKFGAKFSMSWVRAGADEYFDLFAAANQLGLTGIWFFEMEGAGDSNFQEFCNAAYLNGWLLRVDDSIIDSPTNLNATVEVPGEVSLTWQNNSTFEKGYILERKQYPSNEFVVIDTIPKKTASFIDETVGDSVTYTYKIRAFNDYGISGYSNEVMVRSLIRPAPKLIAPPDGYIEYSIAISCSWEPVPSAKYYWFQLAADSLFKNIFYENRTHPETRMYIGVYATEIYHYWRVGAVFDNGKTYWSETRKVFATNKPPVYNVQGDISYLSSNYAVYNAKVVLTSLDGAKSFSADADTIGKFNVQKVDPGYYLLNVIKTGDLGGINSADALKVAKFYTGIEAMNLLQLCASDFNNNGIVNNSDALGILMFYSGQIDKLPNNKSDWVFAREENLQNSYMTSPDKICNADTVYVQNSDIYIKIKALCSGDANGSRNK